METITKTTSQLQPGDRVQITHGRKSDGPIVRTVAEVRPNGYLNAKNETLFNVMYAEGQTPQWSGGNSGAPGSEWLVVLPVHTITVHADGTSRTVTHTDVYLAECAWSQLASALDLRTGRADWHVDGELHASMGGE